MSLDQFCELCKPQRRRSDNNNIVFSELFEDGEISKNPQFHLIERIPFLSLLRMVARRDNNKEGLRVNRIVHGFF